MHNISSNLTAMARDLEGAQDKSDKLNRKGAKASSQKVDEASAKLESAAQQWESQAPFIFESLQAVDETRVNHLRDVLTQYQTHETDQAQRVQEIAAQTLAVVLEINTEKEIKDFVAGTVAGKPLAATRTSTRRASIAGRQPSLEQPPPMPHSDTMNSTASATIPPPTRGSVSQQSHHDDDANEQLPTDQPKGTLHLVYPLLPLPCTDLLKNPSFVDWVPCSVVDDDRVFTVVLGAFHLAKVAALHLVALGAVMDGVFLLAHHRPTYTSRAV